MIDQRPSVVDEKTRIGDFELDTIIGKGHKSEKEKYQPFGTVPKSNKLGLVQALQ
jgi:hypothetical protein